MYSRKSLLPSRTYRRLSESFTLLYFFPVIAFMLEIIAQSRSFVKRFFNFFESFSNKYYRLFYYSELIFSLYLYLFSKYKNALPKQCIFVCIFLFPHNICLATFDVIAQTTPSPHASGGSPPSPYATGCSPITLPSNRQDRCRYSLKDRRRADGRL